MRVWGLVYIVCLVFVVSISLSSVEHGGLAVQHTTHALRVQSSHIVQELSVSPVAHIISITQVTQDCIGIHASQDCITGWQCVCGRRVRTAKEEWPQYVEQSGHFLRPMELRMRAIFLKLVGPTDFKLIHILVSPAKPRDKSYDDLLKLLVEHNKITALETVQQFNSHIRSQKPGWLRCMF